MLVNGVPQQHIDIHDRALAYGDGAFETIRLHEGRAILLQPHLRRLKHACTVLGIACDFARLLQEIDSLRDQFATCGILKVVVSRGTGGRGYRPLEGMQANRIITLHALPDMSAFSPSAGVRVFFCRQTLSWQPALAGIKHLNRLEQVMASREWPDADYFEGLMCDQEGHVIEGTRSNLFFAEAGRLKTPALDKCGVAGVLREHLLETVPGAITLGPALTPQRLLQADEIFLCNSVIGVWPVSGLLWQGELHKSSPGQFCNLANEIFQTILKTDETK